MAGMMDSIATINSAVRTLLALIVVGLVSVGGFYGYSQYNKSDLQLREKEKELAQRDQRIKALEGDLDLAKKRAEKLEIALRLHKVEHRLAYIDVLDKMIGADGKSYIDVEFTEVNDKKEPIAKPQQYRLLGKDMYVAGWIVKFDDRFVESGDAERGTPLFAFKSIFGNEQKPIDGFPLDKPGQRPNAYGGAKQVSEFEQKIWDDFWTLVHDESKQHELGVRSPHGTALFIGDVRKGWRYQVKLRASGDLMLEQQGESPREPGPAL